MSSLSSARRRLLDTTSLPERPKRFRALLLTTALLDELTCGFLVVALPLLSERLHLTYAQAGLLFTVGALSSMLIEPLINMLSDRGSKRIPIVLGAVAAAGSFLLAGGANSYLLEVAAFALWSPAIGAAVGLSQAALVDGMPENAERTMMRWTLLSGIGDLLSPLAVGLAVSVGLGWSTLCVFAAATWLITGFLIARKRFPAAATAANIDEPVMPEPLRTSLKEALHNRTLLRWVGIVMLATMPDEVFLAFTAFYLRDRVHAPEDVAGLVLALGISGGLLTLFLLDRLGGRIKGTRLLPWLALISLAGFVVLLASPTVGGVAVGFALVNIGAAGWYPVAQAMAYSSYPGRSGLVLAVISFGMPFEIALPGLIGLLSSRFGLAAGIGFLALSPLGVLLLQLRKPAPYASTVDGEGAGGAICDTV
jgi:FSR family fosmidomycin resistance protein-like MFS transporter